MQFASSINFTTEPVCRLSPNSWRLEHYGEGAKTKERLYFAG